MVVNNSGFIHATCKSLVSLKQTFYSLCSVLTVQRIFAGPTAMSICTWEEALLKDVQLLRQKHADAPASLYHALAKAQRLSGKGCIAFDHTVQAMGINVVNLKVYNSKEELCAALREGRAPKAEKGQYYPRRVKMACFVQI